MLSLIETNEIVLEVIRIWLKTYRRKPRRTIILTSMVFAAIITAVIIMVRHEREIVEQKRIAVEAARRQNIDLHTQLKRLEGLQQSLHNLLTFVQHQKEKIKIEQKAIIDLEAKRADLEPIVRLQQEQIDKLFELQERRMAKKKRWDLAIGFVLGIIGSAVASVVIMIIRGLRRKRQSDRTTNELVEKDNES